MNNKGIIRTVAYCAAIAIASLNYVNARGSPEPQEPIIPVEQAITLEQLAENFTFEKYNYQTIEKIKDLNTFREIVPVLFKMQYESMPMLRMKYPELITLEEKNTKMTRKGRISVKDLYKEVNENLKNDYYLFRNGNKDLLNMVNGHIISPETVHLGNDRSEIGTIYFILNTEILNPENKLEIPDKDMNDFKNDLNKFLDSIELTTTPPEPEEGKESLDSPKLITFPPEAKKGDELYAIDYAPI
ncbi:MAG: hypothetical protein QF362_00170 [Candidatus Woesearchaeota archaeon]|jgi:hypothetical protein|nr:hypothetical protein [Candidatus Woesearchaeota archaeon]|tara:strand:- start:63 stop:794 length:732 start_codon:yes stop_codon:yes gene_type:complete